MLLVWWMEILAGSVPLIMKLISGPPPTTREALFFKVSRAASVFWTPLLNRLIAASTSGGARTAKGVLSTARGSMNVIAVEKRMMDGAKGGWLTNTKWECERRAPRTVHIISISMRRGNAAALRNIIW